MPGRQLKYPSYRILIAILLLITSAIIFLSRLRQKPSPIEATWAPTASSWSNRKQLTIANNSGANLSTNTTYSLTLNTKDLYDSGLIQSDCADIRFYYQPDSTTATKLDYYIEIPSDQTCATSTATTIHFPLQADLTNGSTSPYYYLYFSNSDATSESSISAFDIGDKNATFYCGFKNTTTCINTGGTVPPTTASGAIRYSSPSAISFDGNNDSITINENGTLGTLEYTIELWFKVLDTGGTARQSILERDGNKMDFYILGNTVYYHQWRHTVPQAVVPLSGDLTASGVNPNQWHHIAITRSNTNSKIFLDGVLKQEKTSAEYIGLTGTYYLGHYFTNGKPIHIDEFRLSKISRYTTNFTPQTTPFVRDEFTKLLLHFDENGDDPRNTGKAIDDSGNNNHGTITGAKYVAGIVGINSSTLDSGTLPSQSYASHGGIFLEEGTTNLITNPSFEHSTYDTNWSIGAGCTASVNTTAPFFKFGNNSIKLIATADTDVTTSINPGSTAVHTLSAYVYDYTTGNIGGTISSSVAQLVFNGSAIGTTYTDTGGGWWRLSVGATTGSGSLNYGVQVKSGKTVYIDGVQLERTSYAYTTTYTDGSLGVGYTWNGTTNESTSSRTATSIRYNHSHTPTQGSVSVWFWMSDKWNPSCTGHPGIVFFHSTNKNSIHFGQDCGTFAFEIRGATTDLARTTRPTYGPGKWHHAVGTWDGDYVKLYLDGSFKDDDSQELDSPIIDYITIASGSFYGAYTNGVTSDLRIFDSALSSTEVTSLYYSGLASHQIQTDYTSRYTDGQPPVAYWKLDEGVGSTINDSVSSNHGSLSTGDSAPTWVSGSSCISNNCLSFDGTDDYATVLPTITGLRAISFWLKPTATTTSVLGLNSTQTISITENVISANGFSSPTIYINGQNTTSLNPDEWSHILITSSTSFAVGNLTLGKVSANYFSGYLDEIKLYSYIPTDTEIKKDINLGYSASFGHSPQTDQITPLKSKLIAHYKFDEGYGSTYHDSSTNNYTASGIGNTKPTWINEAKIGKGLNFDGNTNYATATVPNFIDQGAGSWAISSWVKRTGNLGGSDMIIGKTGFHSGITLGNNSDKIRCALINTSNEYYGPYTPSLVTNQWYHLVCQYNSTTNKISIYTNGKKTGEEDFVGTIRNFNNTVYFGGNGALQCAPVTLDEVRLYRQTLSDSEILQDYNQGMSAVMGKSSSNTGSTAPAGSSSQEYCIPGSTDPCSPPVAEWNFDEGVGTTAFDISGNNNHGVFGSGSSAPTWTMGKIGNGLNFDGTDDYLTHTDNDSLDFDDAKYTISVWVKTSDGNGTIIAKGNAPNLTDGWNIGLGSAAGIGSTDGEVYFQQRDSNTGDDDKAYIDNFTINDNQWHHIAAVSDGGAPNFKIFVDGQQKTLTFWRQDGCTSANSSYATNIGGHQITNTDYLSGLIDQVRIYDYARTPAQIAWDYNRGKPIAHYKLDETDDSTAHDSSGNNLHSTLGSGDSSPTWTTGKLNNSSSFDGNDFISIGSTLSNIQSVSFWAKPNSTTQYLLQLNSSNYVQLSSGVVSVTGFSTPTVYIDGTVSTSFPDTNWHHITIVGSTIFTANQTIFGKISTNFYSGLLDDVRIYNYALTDKQVQTIYNNGAVSFN